jgi:hypothetical protein
VPRVLHAKVIHIKLRVGFQVSSNARIVHVIILPPASITSISHRLRYPMSVLFPCLSRPRDSKSGIAFSNARIALQVRARRLQDTVRLVAVSNITTRRSFTQFPMLDECRQATCDGRRLARTRDYHDVARKATYRDASSEKGLDRACAPLPLKYRCDMAKLPRYLYIHFCSS